MTPMTLYSFARTIPALGGRVFMEAAPVGTPFPYAVVWSGTGGVTNAYYGTANVFAVYPSVIVYLQEASTDLPGSGHSATLALLSALRAAKDAIDTHSDGVTPFLAGSVHLVIDGSPMLDQNAAGRYSGTLKLSASIYRR
jgi:hypothetical protein